MLAIRLMQLISVNKADYSKITGILGLMFQLLDDWLNLLSYEASKEYCVYNLEIAHFDICFFLVYAA